MNHTDTSTHCGDLAALQAEVSAIRAELDRRDIEQVTVENAIEYLQDRSGTLLMVLGQVVKITLGRDHEMFKTLYPYPLFENGEHPNCASEAMIFGRPARRWTQFGTKAELRAKLQAAGVQKLSGAPLSMLVRLAWRHRLIPGSVAIRSGRTSAD